jgi:hypothetical protein
MPSATTLHSSAKIRLIHMSLYVAIAPPKNVPPQKMTRNHRRRFRLTTCGSDRILKRDGSDPRPAYRPVRPTVFISGQPELIAYRFSCLRGGMRYGRGVTERKEGKGRPTMTI